MSYATNRPPGMVTVMEGRPGAWHLCKGWSAFEGTRTACGSVIKHDDNWRHVHPVELDVAVTCIACRVTKRVREIFGKPLSKWPA